MTEEEWRAVLDTLNPAWTRIDMACPWPPGPPPSNAALVEALMRPVDEYDYEIAPTATVDWRTSVWTPTLDEWWPR